MLPYTNSSRVFLIIFDGFRPSCNCPAASSVSYILYITNVFHLGLFLNVKIWRLPRNFYLISCQISTQTPWQQIITCQNLDRLPWPQFQLLTWSWTVAVPGNLTFLSQCVQTATSSWSHTFSCLLTTAWKPPITAAAVNSIFVMLTAFVFTPTDVSPCTHNKRREPVF